MTISCTQVRAVPEAASAEVHRNLTDMFEQRARCVPDHVAMRIRTDRGWVPMSTGDLHAKVREVAKGLIAAGVRPGDRVSIIGPTRWEWTLADMACMYAGAVVVPMFDSVPPEQMQAIIADADVRAAIVGTSELAETITPILHAHRGDEAGCVWTMDERADGPDLTDLAALGTDVEDETLEAHRTAASLDELATIVYTSGTTGRPKGARILHRSFVHQTVNVGAAYGRVLSDASSTVIFLPLGHVLARALQWICLSRGMQFSHVAKPKEAVGSLVELEPTFLMVVPMVLEKIRQAAGDKAEAKKMGALWRKATEVAIAWGDDDTERTARLKVQHALFDKLFYRKLRALLGGRIQVLLCGAAALDPDTVRFFRGIGAPVVEGYGLTESTAPLSGNRLDDIRPGTVGLPMPGMTVGISEEGELLAKGPGIFAGYMGPEDTKEAFVDGWFRTGDLAELDAEGRILLTGRSKDVVVTSGGKTINPAAWESVVERHPVVGHAVVLGDGLPHPEAVILIDAERVDAWAKAVVPEWKVPSITEALQEIDVEAVRASIAEAIEAANAKVPSPERVREFKVLLTDLANSTTLMTPTQKLRRAALSKAMGPHRRAH